jgi:hypothetical protein
VPTVSHPRRRPDAVEREPVGKQALRQFAEAETACPDQRVGLEHLAVVVEAIERVCEALDELAEPTRLGSSVRATSCTGPP